ncbi:MAG: glycosyltransferase [Actinomycetota bacterium]|nr:glycosyltransferase [Actinomycetota bacterium]
MKVLLAGDSLFSSTGGGQRFYEVQVRKNPDIQFFALSGGETRRRGSSALPRNLRFVPLFGANRQSVVDGSLDNLLIEGKPILQGKAHDIAFLMDMAASVAGMEFDVVDIPDYLPFSALLPAILRSFDVKVGKFALSMHGTLSMGLTDNWDNNSIELTALRQFEDLLYRSVDVRYAISKRYLDSWTKTTGLGGVLVDPGVSIYLPSEEEKAKKTGSRERQPVVPTLDGAPELCFVGRQEKWKGPDIFVEFCSRLPQNLFSGFKVIGPDVSINGVSSHNEVGKLADRRGLPLAKHEVASREMRDWYSTERKVVMLPSRVDTFNLVALEALLAGCPTIVSIECGVVDYLDEHYPGIPFIRFDPEDMMNSYEAVVDLAVNYDLHKAALLEYLSSIEKSDGHQAGLVDAYAVPLDFDAAARSSIDDIWLAVLASFEHWVNQAIDNLEQVSLERFQACLPGYESSRLTDDFVSRQHSAAVALDAISTSARRSEFVAIESLIGGNSRLLNTMSFEFNRANLFRLLARFELGRGNDLLFATYMCRVMRLTGGISAQTLQDVTSILINRGMREEARVLALLSEGNQEDIFDYLQARRSIDFSPPVAQLQTVHDTRIDSNPKVSVIVSVYNAAPLVAAFLRELARQSPDVLANSEYVFVDSNSTDDSAAVLKRELTEGAGKNLSALVVTTPDRETIQRAWNRGIGLARGEYVSFLGVDETVRPDAYAILAKHLDENPNVDWVQGNVTVTEVNERGSFVKDVMPYIRTFEMQEMHYLDSCYIGFVGALYRKSVHERFGLYDDSFSGAGDTEFKNRILPFITVETIPEMLGTYLNYPAERTTASPAVELEDLRAWYVYRSPGGVRYLFDDADSEDVAALLLMCLGYRKTYLDFTCTDAELATSIVAYATDWLEEPNSTVENWKSAVWFMLQACQRADDLQTTNLTRGVEGARLINGAMEWVWNALAEAQQGMGGHGARAFEILNDNRWQQHHWIWPSVPSNWAIPEIHATTSPKPLTLSDVLASVVLGLGTREGDIRVDLGDSGLARTVDLWDSLDLLLVTSNLESTDPELINALTAEGNLTVVLLETDSLTLNSHAIYSPSLVRVNAARIRQVGMLLEAARVVAVAPETHSSPVANFHFDLSSQTVEVILNASLVGVPLVLSQEAAAALNARMGLTAMDGFHGSLDLASFVVELATLVGSAQARESSSRSSFRVASTVVALGKVKLSSRIQERLDRMEWTEYSVSEQDFDEDFYMATYPDVLEAIESGLFTGAWEHFQTFGRSERRVFRLLGRSS